VAALALFAPGVARAQTEAPREPTQQSQQAAIRDTVAQFDLRPDPEGRVFFLGFAGYGEERVFAEEIKLAARTVNVRYASGQRSLLLINDRRDLVSHPLATHENLRFALAELAKVMDLENDVLFLALSSHGDENGLLEVSNTGMMPVGLSATRLARYLKEAGIRWRIVVVSACHSGAFIEPLASSRSFIITAASKTTTSFGCSDDRDLTYFGEAFYRDALPAHVTLREAFDFARVAIRDREKLERFKPSQPQSYFGLMLEDRLQQFALTQARKALEAAP
jgi:hypothetical protein